MLPLRWKGLQAGDAPGPASSCRGHIAARLPGQAGLPVVPARGLGRVPSLPGNRDVQCRSNRTTEPGSNAGRKSRRQTLDAGVPRVTAFGRSRA